LKEFAVNPTGVPFGPRAVTIVTPVANMPSAARNSCVEKLGASAWRGGVIGALSRIGEVVAPA
jgi:hypothetical protein